MHLIVCWWLPTSLKNAAILQLNDYLKRFIRTTPNGTLGVLALGWASRSLPPAEMDSALNNLKTRFPGNTFLAEMEKGSQQQPEQPASGDSWVGKMVPELSYAGCEWETGFHQFLQRQICAHRFLGELVRTLPDGKSECGKSFQ